MREIKSGRPRGRRRIAAMALVGASLAALMGSATVAHSALLPAGPLNGAGMEGSAGIVDVYHTLIGTHRLYISISSCHTDVALSPLDFKAAPDLSAAKVTKVTSCGLVTVNWTGVGGLHHVGDSFWRYANASGHVGLKYVASYASSFGFIQLYPPL